MYILVEAFELPTLMCPLELHVDQGTGFFVKE